MSGNAGNALATNNAPAQGSCGTTNRLYMKNNHPSLADGEVTFKLCVAVGNEACKFERSIARFHSRDQFLDYRCYAVILVYLNCKQFFQAKNGTWLGGGLEHGFVSNP